LEPLEVPVQPALWLLALVLGFLGASQFYRGFQRRSTLFLGISFGVFTVAMMVWAKRRVVT
jgi:TM2 domain-containing membrane protein YozV